MASANISDTIKSRIEKLVKDPKERQLLFDLLECELSYVDQEKPDFRKDYKIILEQRFPFRNSSE